MVLRRKEISHEWHESHEWERGHFVRAIRVDSWLVYLDRGRDGFVEDLQGDVDVFFCEDERRRPADRVGAAAEDDEAAVEAGHFYAVAEFGIGFKCYAVSDKFDAEHHAHSANVADHIIFFLQITKSSFEISSDLA